MGEKGQKGEKGDVGAIGPQGEPGKAKKKNCQLYRKHQCLFQDSRVSLGREERRAIWERKETWATSERKGNRDQWGTLESQDPRAPRGRWGSRELGVPPGHLVLKVKAAQ